MLIFDVDFEQLLQLLAQGRILDAVYAGLYSVMGPWLWLFLCLLFAVPLYVKTLSIVPPVVVFMLFSGIILAYMPVEAHKVAYVLAVLAVASILYRLFTRSPGE